MVARVSSADNFSVYMPAKGLAGAGFRIAVIKSVRAAVAASKEKSFCHGNVCGEPINGFENAFC